MDNRPPLPHSPIDFEHGMGHREIDHRSGIPYPPPDMFRYNSGNCSRRGADYDDSYQPNPREEVLRGRGEENYCHHDHHKEDSNISFMECGASRSPLSRDKFTSGSFDKHRYGSNYEKESFRSRRNGNVVGKNQRWVHSKQTFRNMHNSYLDGSNDRHGDRTDFRNISGKHGHSNAELGKYYYDNKGGMEGYNEYTSTPRKQVQKKSAFLRIQMANPCHSNRESEQLRDSEYFDEKSSFLRGKSQVRSLCYRMDSGKKREGSPMELDVSFKSNSLVAKAIVAPTQSTPISDVETRHVNEKTDSTNSHLTGQNKVDSGANDVTNLVTCPPDIKNELKDLEEKATGPLVGNGSNNLTDASSVKGSYSLRKTNVERPSQGKVSDVEGKNVSGKAAMVRTMKKKKVVRKVVKKVASSQLGLQTRKGADDPPVKVGSLTNIPPDVTGSGKDLEVSENKISTSGKNSDRGFVSKAFQPDMSGSLDNRKGDQSVLPVASKKCQANTVMGMECVPADKSNKNRLGSPLNSLTKEGRGTSDHLETNSSFIAIPPLLNSSKNLLLQNGHNKLDFGISKGIEDSSFENVSGSKTTMVFLGGSQSGSLSPNDPNLLDDLVNENNLTVRIDTPMDFDNGVTQFEDNTPLSETFDVDGICKRLYTNKVTRPLETDVVGVSAGKVTIKNPLVGVNPEASEIQVDSLNLEVDNSDQHIKRNSNDCHQCTNILGGEVFNCERVGISRVQECVGSSSVSLGFSLEECSSKVKDPTLSGEGEKLLSKVSELDFAGPNDIDQEINSENLCESFNSEGHWPSEQDISGLGSKLMWENPTTFGEGANLDYTSLGKLPKNKLLMGFDVDNTGTEVSLKTRKKQKICIDSPVLSCPSGEINDGAAITFISSLSDQLNSNGELMEGKKVAVSTVDAFFTASTVSTDCLKGMSMVLDDIPTKETAIEVNIERNPLECLLKYEQLEKNSCSIQVSTVSKCQSLSPSLGYEQGVTGATLMATNQSDDMDVVTDRRKELNIHAAEGQSTICNKTEQWDSPSEVPSSQTLDRPNPESVKSSSNVGQDNLHHIEISFDEKGYPAANSDREIKGSMFDTRGHLGSSEASNVPEMHKLSCEASFSHTDSKMDCADDEKVKKKSNVENELKASTDTPFSQPLAVHRKLGCTNSVNILSTGNILPQALEALKNGLQADNNSSNSCKKEQKMSYYKSQAFPAKSFSTYPASKNLTSAAYSKKPRSWHRNVNSPSPALGNKPSLSSIPPQGQLHGGGGMLQSTSYIRKGNSLVRKPSPVGARVLGSHDLSSSSLDQHDCWPGVKSNNKVEVTNSCFHSKARGTDANVYKTYPPRLSSGSESPNYSVPVGDCAPSPCHETESNLMKSKHVSDLSKSVGDSLKILPAPKSQVVTADKKENLAEMKNTNSVSLVLKKMVYVKRKSNQLVATSNPCDLSTKNSETTCSLGSDGYYKRKKNQLIRAPSECQTKQTLLPTEDISKPGAQSSYGDGDARNFNKRRQFKGIIAK